MQVLPRASFSFSRSISTCTFAFYRVLVGTQDTCEVKEVKKAKEVIEAGYAPQWANTGS